MPITDMALVYKKPTFTTPTVVYPEFMTETNPFGFGQSTGAAGMALVTWYNKDTGESYVAPNTSYRPPKGQEGSWTTQQPTNWKDISAGKTPVEGWGKRPEPDPNDPRNNLGNYTVNPVTGDYTYTGPDPNPPVSGIQWGDPLSGDYVKGPAPSPSPSPTPTSGVVPRQTITTGGARISDQGPMPAPTATIPQDPRYNLPTYVVPGEGKVALPGMAQGGAVEDHVDIMRSIGIDPKGEVTPEQLDRFNREYNDFLDKRRQKEENWDYEFKEHDAVLARGYSKGGSVTQYDQLFFEKGKEYGVDPMILKGIASVESNFNPKAVGPKTRSGSAQGMMQFIPAMQKPYGITDPFDPEQSVAGSARMMRDLLKRYKGDVGKALEAYNGGPRLVGKSTQTRKYAEKVQRKAQLFAKSTQKPAIEVAGTATQGPSALSRTPQVSQQTPKFNAKPKTGELTASLDDLGNEYKAAIALTYLTEDDSDGLTITERAEQLLADQEEDSSIRGDALSQIFTMEPTETEEAGPFDVYAAAQNPQPQQSLPEFNEGGFVFGGTSLPGMPNTYLEPVGQLTPEVKRILEELEPANEQYKQEVQAYNKQYEDWLAKANEYNKAVEQVIKDQETYNKYVDFYTNVVAPTYEKAGAGFIEYAPSFEQWAGSSAPVMVVGNHSFARQFQDQFGWGWNKEKGDDALLFPKGDPASWEKSLPTSPGEFKAPAPKVGYDLQQYEEKLAPLRRAQENVAKYGQERELALAVASNPDAYNLAGFGMAEGGAVDKRTALDRVRDFLQALDVTPLDALYATGRAGAGAAFGLIPSSLNEGEDELLAKYRAMAERERSTPQPPMARSEGSPPYGEDSQMFSGIDTTGLPPSPVDKAVSDYVSFQSKAFTDPKAYAQAMGENITKYHLDPLRQDPEKYLMEQIGPGVLPGTGLLGAIKPRGGIMDLGESEVIDAFGQRLGYAPATEFSQVQSMAKILPNLRAEGGAEITPEHKQQLMNFVNTKYKKYLQTEFGTEKDPVREVLYGGTRVPRGGMIESALYKSIDEILEAKTKVAASPNDVDPAFDLARAKSSADFFYDTLTNVRPTMLINVDTLTPISRKIVQSEDGRSDLNMLIGDLSAAKNEGEIAAVLNTFDSNVFKGGLPSDLKEFVFNAAESTRKNQELINTEKPDPNNFTFFSGNRAFGSRFQIKPLFQENVDDLNETLKRAVGKEVVYGMEEPPNISALNSENILKTLAAVPRGKLDNMSFGQAFKEGTQRLLPFRSFDKAVDDAKAGRALPKEVLFSYTTPVLDVGIVNKKTGKADPFKWVKLDDSRQAAIEGALMHHSIGGYNSNETLYSLGGKEAFDTGFAKLYSLRSTEGNPSVSLEYGRPIESLRQKFLQYGEDPDTDLVRQIQGDFNSAPVDYIQSTLAMMKKEGLNVKKNFSQKYLRDRQGDLLGNAKDRPKIIVEWGKLQNSFNSDDPNFGVTAVEALVGREPFVVITTSQSVQGYNRVKNFNYAKGGMVDKPLYDRAA